MILPENYFITNKIKRIVLNCNRSVPTAPMSAGVSYSVVCWCKFEFYSNKLKYNKLILYKKKIFQSFNVSRADHTESVMIERPIGITLSIVL